MMAVPVRFLKGVSLTAAARATLREALSDLGTLADVVRWGLEQQPPRLVTDVVHQDEYTLDVCLPLEATLVLVFDTT